MPFTPSACSCHHCRKGSDAPGSDAIVDKLSEILLIHVIRIYKRQTKTTSDLSAALADSHISKVLAETHHQPGLNCSVERLAEKAGPSGSAFSRHFHQVTQITPMQYVTQRRMQTAYEKLGQQDCRRIRIPGRNFFQKRV